MKAFITGITGFVGGHLTEHLLAAGDAVLGSSTQGDWPAARADLRCPPAAVRERVEVVRWDLGDPNGLAPAARAQIAGFAPDCIYHLAALSVPAHCGEQAPTERALAVNVEGTARVLELAASLPRRPRVLFASSSHVYAPAAGDSRLSESSPLGPRRGYGMTKLLAERRIESIAREQGLDVLVARAFQHTGPRQEPEMMLPEWIEQLVGNGAGPIRVRSLHTWIDLTDVGDVVRAYRLLLERAEAGVYNVGSGAPRLTGEIFETLVRLAGVSRTAQELTAGGPKRDPIADIGRLTARTGWRPEISLEQTIQDTLEYWRGRKSKGT